MPNIAGNAGNSCTGSGLTSGPSGTCDHDNRWGPQPSKPCSSRQQSRSGSGRGHQKLRAAGAAGQEPLRSCQRLEAQMQVGKHPTMLAVTSIAAAVCPDPTRFLTCARPWPVWNAPTAWVWPSACAGGVERAGFRPWHCTVLSRTAGHLGATSRAACRPDMGAPIAPAQAFSCRLPSASG